jgi:hypothetical protein
MNDNLVNEGVSKHGRDHHHHHYRAGAATRSCMRLSWHTRALDPTDMCGCRMIQMTRMTWILLGAEICQSSDPSQRSCCDDEYGVDNGAGDSASETTSLNSSIFHYRHENGRRYHAYKDGEYWGPNDEKQNEQLDIACVHWHPGKTTARAEIRSLNGQSSSLDPPIRWKAIPSPHFKESSGSAGLLG